MEVLTRVECPGKSEAEPPGCHRWLGEFCVECDNSGYAQKWVPLEELLASTGVKPECGQRPCLYFTHYLANKGLGQSNFSHDAYHAAEAKCRMTQWAAMRWLEKHKCSTVPCKHINPYEQDAQHWEREVRV